MVDQFLLTVLIDGDICTIEEICFGFIVGDEFVRWSGAIVVNEMIVYNAHHPRGKFAILGILPILDTHYNLDKDILKEIFCKFLVFDRIKKVGEYLLFVSFQQCVERTVIAFLIQTNQLLVGEFM